jgi:hypothetical protein
VVTPTYMLFAVLAFLAMLAILVAFVVMPDTGHFATIQFL